MKQCCRETISNLGIALGGTILVWNIIILIRYLLERISQ